MILFVNFLHNSADLKHNACVAVKITRAGVAGAKASATARKATAAAAIIFWNLTAFVGL